MDKCCAAKNFHTDKTDSNVSYPCPISITPDRVCGGHDNHLQETEANEIEFLAYLLDLVQRAVKYHKISIQSHGVLQMAIPKFS